MALLLASWLASSAVVDTRAPVATTAAAFLGVNIDSASLYQGARVDFGDADLVALTCRLAAAGDARLTLRLGGSAADDLSTFVNDTDHGQIFLPVDYWDQLVAFVDRCRLNLAWDLNMRVGRHADATRPWDPVDAARLLDHVRTQGQTVWAYQLGNEPGHWQTRNGGAPNATDHGRDFRALKALLDAAYGGGDGGGGGGGGETARPRIAGPDLCHGEMTDASPCADDAYFQEVLTSAGPGTLDDVTVHAYGLTGPKGGRPANATNCFVADFLNRTLYRQSVVPVVAAWQAAARTLAPGAQFVVSETATAADGGCPGLSNRFVAGFYFVDMLGELGAMGVHQVYRQDLVGFSGIGGGSSYALLGPPGWHDRASGGRLTPNPDYFTAVLWRSLVGARRLAVADDAGAAPSRGPTLHAACAVGGGVVVAFGNPTAAAVELTLRFEAGEVGESEAEADESSSTLELYVLTGNGSLTSPHVWLNGVRLEDASSPLTPVTRAAGGGAPVALPAFSYGFVVDRGAPAPACA